MELRFPRQNVRTSLEIRPGNRYLPDSRALPSAAHRFGRQQGCCKSCSVSSNSKDKVASNETPIRSRLRPGICLSAMYLYYRNSCCIPCPRRHNSQCQTDMSATHGSHFDALRPGGPARQRGEARHQKEQRISSSYPPNLVSVSPVVGNVRRVAGPLMTVVLTVVVSPVFTVRPAMMSTA